MRRGGGQHKGTNLVEFNLVVKGHGGHALLTGVLEMRRLFARIGVDDSIGAHVQVQHTLDFSLRVIYTQELKHSKKPMSSTLLISA